MSAYIAVEVIEFLYLNFLVTNGNIMPWKELGHALENGKGSGYIIQLKNLLLYENILRIVDL